MKKKTTEPAKDPIAEYRRLLTICAVQFTRLSHYFANNPTATLPEHNREIAFRLVRDTHQAGEAARLSIAYNNAGLANELRVKQDDFNEHFAKLSAHWDCVSAGLLAASADIVQSTLDSITELLSGDGGVTMADLKLGQKILQEGQGRIAATIGVMKQGKIDKRLQREYAERLYEEWKGTRSPEKIANEVVLMAEIPDDKGVKHLITDGYKPTKRGIDALSRCLRRKIEKQ